MVNLNKRLGTSLFVIALMCTSATVLGQRKTAILAQDKVPYRQDKEWFLKDYSIGFPGVGLSGYRLELPVPNNKFLIAVIDDGIDKDHKGLKDFVYINKLEKANGKDDDGNGFVDDSYGWNFLGGKNGGLVNAQLAITRAVKAGEARFGKKTFEQFESNQKQPFTEFYHQRKKLQQLQQGYADAYAKLKSRGVLDSASKLELDYLETAVNYSYNLDIDPRAAIGDDPNRIDGPVYGNNKVWEGTAGHGTPVSGVVAQVLNTGLGAAVAPKYAAILSVRAVPSSGDEYDKDVALAIRYAVDRGAKVINMSFGKALSEHRGWVADAMKYAQSRDVLLIHPAGNEGANIDVDLKYPNDAYDSDEEYLDNFISVGAVSHTMTDSLVAEFSNYGKKNVDIFAPGVEIWSMQPKNKYGPENGTSFSGPIVTGLAALIRIKHPKLSAAQVKDIILRSGTKIAGQVLVPGGKGKKAEFAELSKTGAIVDARAALEMAASLDK